jgi:RNA polymerase sigma-70 factor, ECF subfamily
MADALAVFTHERDRLFAIAYRMLGSVEDAEDVLQDTFLRWHRTPIETVDSPPAWLTTVVTRIALHQLQSARVTREAYVGPWLPEPILTEAGASPSDQAEMSDSLSIAFLTVLERLSPRERAVFLLRDVFSYEYEEIAQIVELSESNCRQIFHRAKLRLDARRKRFLTDDETHRKLLDGFLRAINDGDVDGVVKLLARDAVLWADGGGRIPAAASRPVRGALSVAKFLVGVRRKFGVGDITMRVVNGRLSLIASIDSVLQRVVSIDVAGGSIAGVYVVANPDKLRSVSRALM